ncbi:ATP-binding protein [Pseudoalteromonas sp. SMS1]|uniref:ATP-binding protein n=1 Tax=Pseudoalteromonas sp. SMS1 TaxID=2908894 RepID=UPI001F2C0F6D|nr:ATP-binding protein [Pseudoalteromonas sp. SMS1]MCF2857758.1 ATP-binding protein [Pseudoalteromonas sp. SMS1]
MFKRLAAASIFSLAAIGLPVAASEVFPQYKALSEAKGKKDRPALLELANALLQDETLSAEEITYVLHRSALHLVRENQFEHAQQRLTQLALHLKDFPDDNLQGKYHWVSGDLSLLLGDNQAAEYHFGQAVVLFTQTQDIRMLSHAHRLLANVLSAKRDYFQAVSHVYQAKDTALKINHTQLFDAALSTEARIYSDFKQFDKALDVLNQKLQVQNDQAQVSQAHLSATYFSLAKIYRNLSDHEAALSAFKKAYELDAQLQDKNYMGISLLQIANQHLELDDITAAQLAVEQALTLFKTVKNSQNIGQAQAMLGQVKLAKQQFDEAITLLKTGLEKISYDKNRQLNEKYSAYLGQALSYTQPARAVALLTPMLDSASSHNTLRILTSLSRAHKHLAHFEQALSYHEQALSHKQILNEQEITARLQAKKLNSELGLKSLEVSELQAGLEEQQQDTKTRTVVLASAIIVLTNFLLLFYLYHLKRRRVMEKETELLNQSLNLKQQLLADVSHELRTPLTVLKLNIEALEYNLTEDPKATYQVLQRRLDMLNTLIADIYELAQADTNNLRLEFETLQASSLFDELLIAIGPIIDVPDIEVSYDNHLQDSLQVECDISRLNQVFNNLARNSVHYTDRPGKIKIRVYQQHHTIVCTFEDSAPGVSSAALGKLFERLYRCDKSRSRDLGGSGLGLSICEKIIELHHGAIEAKHSELGGVFIKFTLPIKLTHT